MAGSWLFHPIIVDTKKKSFFEKVMFFIDKENNNNFLTVYGVLLTVMIVKGIYDRDFPG